MLIQEDFVNDEGQDRHFPIGIISIEAEDSSTLTFNADNATVRITVGSESEERTFTESRDRWYDALTFETTPDLQAQSSPD